MISRATGRQSRSLRRTAAVAAAVAVAAVGALGTASAGAATPKPAPKKTTTPKPPTATAQITIPSVAHPGTPIPQDFLGLSFEADALAAPQLDPAVSNLGTLMRAIGPGIMRFGGTTLDRDTVWLLPGETMPSWASIQIDDTDLQRLERLSVASGWKVELGVNLRVDDPAEAAAEAAAAQQILGSNLEGIEIGNEPEAFVMYGWRPATWGLADYESEIQAYAAAISAAAPGVAILGANSNDANFLAAFAEVSGTPGYPLTAHAYSLNACGAVIPTITDLLGGGVAYTTDKHVIGDVAVAAVTGHTVRIDETNSIACEGLANASDTHAGALWAADDILRLAKDGAVGINLHDGTPGVCRQGTTPWYAPICAASPAALAAGQLSPQPEWYAMKLLAPLLGTGLLPASQSSIHNVRSWATVGADGTVRVVIDDMQGGGTDTVKVTAPAQYGLASLNQINGPNLIALDSTTYGGAFAGLDGTVNSTPVTTTDAAGTLYVKVPGASVTVLTLKRACTVPALSKIDMSKGTAEKLLTTNGCATGKVVTKKAPKGAKAQYVVDSQQTKAGKVGKYGTKIGFVLVPKKKAKPVKKAAGK